MFDLHVHAAPDVVPRRGTDRETLRAYAAAGFTGCVLKAHYDTTAGRALAAADGTGVAAFGGIALNRHVGGLNPSAVEAALRSGARVVWMPTADSHTQRTAGLPRLCDLRPSLGDETFALPPVDPSAEAATREVVALVAEHDAVLATGHISGAEVAWLLPVARAAGVRRLLLTHPSYTVPGLDAGTTRDLAGPDALVEVTAFQLLHQPGATAAGLAAFVAEVGLERVVLSSDAGQPDSPEPPAALLGLLKALEAEGLDPAALRRCADEQPRGLVLG